MKRIIFIILLFFSFFYSNSVKANDIILKYDLTNLDDTSGNNHTLINSGGVFLNSDGATFNGNNFLKTSNLNLPLNNFTFLFEFYYDDVAGSYPIFTYGKETNNTAGISFGVGGSNFYGDIGKNIIILIPGVARHNTGIQFVNGKNQIGLIINSNNTKTLFHNGFFHNIPYNQFNTSDQVLFGFSPASPPFYGNLFIKYNSKIKNFVLYNKVLNSFEISSFFSSSSSSSSSSGGGLINIDLSGITTILTNLFSGFSDFFTNIGDFLSNLINFNFEYSGFNFDLQKYKNVFSFDFGQRNYIINNENCENIINKNKLGEYYYYAGGMSYWWLTPTNSATENNILGISFLNSGVFYTKYGYTKGGSYGYESNNEDYYYNDFNYLSITNKDLFYIDTTVFDDFNIIPFSISIFGFDIVNLINDPLKYFFKLVLLIIELPISLINIIANMYFYLFPPFVAGESYCYAGQLITIPNGYNTGTRITGNNNYGGILYILILSFIAFKKGKIILKSL